MKILEIPFVGFPVTDVERSRTFYEQVLGLKLTMLHELEPDSGQYWIEYNIGASCLAISNMWPPTGAPGGPTLALEVDDLDQAMQELKDNGAKVTSEVMQSPSCRFFMFDDPDGNPLMMHQMKG
jgi:predicted enzyme related to lactoylglutathione lyase